MKMRDTAKRNRHYRCLEYDHDQGGELFLFACGIDRCDPGVSYGPDARDGYHLHAVLSGTGTLYAGGQEFHPRFGQLFLLKDGETVRYVADRDDPWQYCWVAFNGSEARSLCEEIGFTEGVYCLDSSVDAAQFYEMILRMHERPEMTPVSDLRRRGILLEFLALAMEATTPRGRRAGRRAEHPSKTYVDRAVAFIHYNYATIRVADIVKYIGFTRSYFTGLFKQQTGLSPQEYLMQVRLREACRLLETTDQPVARIAEQVGYDNPLNFSRAFRSAFGISPTQYRLLPAGENGAQAQAAKQDDTSRREPT